jgi:hypothetical protein
VSDPVEREADLAQACVDILKRMPFSELLPTLGRGLRGDELRRVVAHGLVTYEHERVRRWHNALLDKLASIGTGDGIPPDEFETDRLLASAVVMTAREGARRGGSSPA